MALNLILAVCMLALGTCVGKLFSNRYSEKYKFYKSIYDFNCDLLREVCFFKNNVRSLCKKEYISSAFNDLIKMKGEGNNVSDKIPSYLSDVQKNDIIIYFDKLGKTDAAMQSMTCEGYKEKFANELSISLSEQKKYGNIYKKTGFLVGLIAFVIII